MKGITKIFASVILSSLFGFILGLLFFQYEIFREILAYISLFSLSAFSGYAISKTILDL